MIEPVKEHTQFAAGLSFIAALPPAEASALLEKRVRLLEKEVGKMHSVIDGALEGGLPRLFLVEAEHEMVLRRGDLLPPDPPFGGCRSPRLPDTTDEASLVLSATEKERKAG